MGVRPSRNVSKHALDTNRKKWANVFANIISAQIRLYYELDDISRIMTGTRDTITRGGSKQQWRVLLDTMLNLNAKFREELTVLRSHTVSFHATTILCTAPDKPRQRHMLVQAA